MSNTERPQRIELPELKRCPFCGGEAKLVRENIYPPFTAPKSERFIRQYIKVRCTVCCNSSAEFSPENNGNVKAVEYWNIRVTAAIAPQDKPQDGLREAWRDISSASKDGTWVLVRGGKTMDEADEREIAVVQWTTYPNGHECEGHWQFAWYDGGYYGEYSKPTHWMPLEALAASPAAQHEAMAPAGVQNAGGEMTSKTPDTHSIGQNMLAGSDADVARAIYGTFISRAVGLDEATALIAQHVAARTKPLVEALEKYKKARAFEMAAGCGVRTGEISGYMHIQYISEEQNAWNAVQQALAQEKGLRDG